MDEKSEYTFSDFQGDMTVEIIKPYPDDDERYPEEDKYGHVIFVGTKAVYVVTSRYARFLRFMPSDLRPVTDSKEG